MKTMSHDLLVQMAYTIRDCRVHFFRQPFSKHLYNQVEKKHLPLRTQKWVCKTLLKNLKFLQKERW